MKRTLRKITDLWLLLCIAVFATGCAPLGFLGGLGSLLGGLAIGGGIAGFSSGGGGGTNFGGGSLPGGGGNIQQLALNSLPGSGGGSGFEALGGGGSEVATIVNPEPASMMLLGSGIAAMTLMRARSKNKS